MHFPEPHIQHPHGEHIQTAIFLHGRGSNGAEFAEDLFSSVNSQGQTLPESLPHMRWVFPNSGSRWNVRFQEEMPSWFDAYSLDHIEERQESQVEGLRESVFYILDLLNQEIQQLGGKSHRVYLGGISQGMAIALWSLICGPAELQSPLGGVLGFCGWLPFAGQVEDLLKGYDDTFNVVDALSKQRQASKLLLDVIAELNTPKLCDDADISVLSTPVFLSHGTDDTWVPVELSIQATQILQNLGVSIERNEFTGAEGDGHWIKEPEGFDQITKFLQHQIEGND
ncbi:Alpha/Beta hydrolase protein [Penicillium angulare]|uniref:Alpha/Beta hydrolase protein n=1 Tax=Penicillium angulare TaxID=116970 RepID=UPI002541E332|nr:Alpha/Beta hydrolase protein [Penicillium angulare]KAJ5279079.1 Alpha/Beta hydrolase protein [Penicillium angulare]